MAGRPRERPCGAPHVAEYRGYVMIVNRESSPLFNRVLSVYFFRVGLCSHTVLPLQDAWQHDGRRIRSRRWRSRGPESTRSSIQHVRKCSLKWRRSEGSQIATWRQEEGLSSSTFRPRDRDPTATRSWIFAFFLEDIRSVRF